MLELSTNRGNDLLLRMLSARYPRLVSDDAVSLLYSALDQPLFNVQEDLKHTELTYLNFIQDRNHMSRIKDYDGPLTVLYIVLLIFCN